MDPDPRICVVIPVYNHGQTVAQVVRGAKAFCPVIVVDDGSTDHTARVLAEESGIELITLPQNRGKGAALGAGFARATQRGFTHVITIDADGQHSPDALNAFAAACRQDCRALVIGVRDLRAAGAPWTRRVSNQLSNFCFRLETRQYLTDTQCGYRCYALAALDGLNVSSGRYAFELEVLVKAAWRGVRLVPCPVAADYAAATSRLSHFSPWRDMLQVSWLHLRLLIQSPVRRLASK
jgi:glycosyltransferase involved in cell wall biosynthesis